MTSPPQEALPEDRQKLKCTFGNWVAIIEGLDVYSIYSVQESNIMPVE